MNQIALRLALLTSWDGPLVCTEFTCSLLAALLDAGAAITLLGPAAPLHGVWRRTTQRCETVAPFQRCDPRAIVAVCHRAALRHLLIAYHPNWLPLNALTALVEACAEQRITCAVTLPAGCTLTAAQLYPLDRVGATLVVPSAALGERLGDQGIVNLACIPPGVHALAESVEEARAHFGIAQGPVLGVAGTEEDVPRHTVAILRELYPDILLFRPADLTDPAEQALAFRACDVLLLLPDADEETTLATALRAVAARRPLVAIPPWNVAELADVVYRVAAAGPPVVALGVANMLSSPLLQSSLVRRVERYVRGRSWRSAAGRYLRVLFEPQRFREASLSSSFTTL